MGMHMDTEMACGYWYGYGDGSLTSIWTSGCVLGMGGYRDGWWVRVWERGSPCG